MRSGDPCRAARRACRLPILPLLPGANAGRVSARVYPRCSAADRASSSNETTRFRSASRQQGPQAGAGGRARLADGADTLITAGAVQSNHARVTAPSRAKLACAPCSLPTASPVASGRRMRCSTTSLVPEVTYVESREDRAPKIREISPSSCESKAVSPSPFTIGASTPLGALAFALAVAELLELRCRRRTSSFTRPRLAAHRRVSSRVVGCWACRRASFGISAGRDGRALQSQVRANS